MNWGYVAGYFDGEGTVNFYPRKQSASCALVWHNSNEPSLQAMQEFMGCGRVRLHTSRPNGYRPMYGLHIERRRDMLAVIPELLNFCIIKRDQLLALHEHLVTKVKDQPSGWGALAALGVDEVRRLYWEDRLSQREIGLRVGVTQGAVKQFMYRNGIPTRSPSDANRLAQLGRDPAVEAERRAKISEARRKSWQDPAYREKTIAGIRAVQSQRIATRAANRAAT